MKLKINPFDSNSIKVGIKQLKQIKTNIQRINDVFIRHSLKWIRDRANQYLDERVYAYPNSANVSSGWEIEVIQPTHDGEIAYRLINQNELATFVEFGTGIVGLNDPHPKAESENYKYDMNNRGLQGWNFRFYYNGQWYTYEHFTGYEGKHFLYDAYFDYYHNKEYVNIYRKIIKSMFGEL